MKLTYADVAKENWFLVSWTLSNKCNYKCSYCPEHLHSGSTGQPKWETVKHFVENFKIPNKHICYRLSGGEPTHWKHFIDLAKLVKEQGHAFSFLTNGSKSVDYYKEISKYAKGFIISYHPAYADIQHFINIANVVQCDVAVNLMMLPGLEDFKKLEQIAKQMYDNTEKLAIWPKIILDKTTGEDITNKISEYTLDQKTIIKDWPYFRKLNDYDLHRGELLLDDSVITANDLIVSGKNNFKGWKCWAGLHMINIDMWGNMYRADCQEGGAIGNIERYKLPTETLICGKNVCACLSDIYLRKETF